MDRMLTVVSFALAMAAGLCIPSLTYIFGNMLNPLRKEEKRELIVTAILHKMTYLAIGELFAAGWHVLCWTIAVSCQVTRIRLRFFKAVLRQDLGWHDEHSSGELSSCMTGDTRVIQNGINDKLSQGVVYAAMALAGFIYGLTFSLELTLVVLGMMLPTAIAGLVLSGMVTEYSEQARKSFYKTSAMSTGAMGNIRTLRTFGKED